MFQAQRTGLRKSAVMTRRVPTRTLAVPSMPVFRSPSGFVIATSAISKRSVPSSRMRAPMRSTEPRKDIPGKGWNFNVTFCPGFTSAASDSVAGQNSSGSSAVHGGVTSRSTKGWCVAAVNALESNRSRPSVRG